MPWFKRHKKNTALSDNKEFTARNPEGAQADLGHIWHILAKFRKDWSMSAISCNCV